MTIFFKCPDPDINIAGLGTTPGLWGRVLKTAAAAAIIIQYDVLIAL
jgi:hypothetical protein